MEDARGELVRLILIRDFVNIAVVCQCDRASTKHGES